MRFGMTRITFLFFTSALAADYGILELDNFTFPLIVGRHYNCLVRFEKEYPYGDKADAFKAAAVEVVKSEAETIVAAVPISTWGERRNNDLAVKFGFVKKDQHLEHSDMDSIFPKFRFFPKNNGEPADYTGPVTKEGLLGFLKEKAGIYFGLPGCVKVLDELAEVFHTAPKDTLAKAEATAAELEQKDKAAYYLKVMKKAIDSPEYPEKEKARLETLLKSSTVTAEKKQSMSTRLNVLSSFKSAKKEL